jgi:hypothetical protein
MHVAHPNWNWVQTVDIREAMTDGLDNIRCRRAEGDWDDNDSVIVVIPRMEPRKFNTMMRESRGHVPFSRRVHVVHMYDTSEECVQGLLRQM